MGEGYLVLRSSDVDPLESICGESRRILTRRDTEKLSLHVVRIREAKRHYHERCTEVYYVVDGRGVLEVGGEEVEMEPGVVVLIEPGTAHAGRGDFEAVVVTAPAWDEGDEHPA